MAKFPIQLAHCGVVGISSCYMHAPPHTTHPLQCSEVQRSSGMAAMISWAHCDCRRVQSVKVRDFCGPRSHAKENTKSHSKPQINFAASIRGELVFEESTAMICRKRSGHCTPLMQCSGATAFRGRWSRSGLKWAISSETRFCSGLLHFA